MNTLNLKFEIREVSDQETVVSLETNCSDPARRANIFWRYSGEKIPKKESMNGNFALVAMLPYAMHHRLNIHLEGCADRELIAALEECQDLWTLWRPDLYQRINIFCDHISLPEITPGGKTVMAFSGGVDACYSLHAHQNSLLGSRSKRIDLGLLILGFDIERSNPEWIEIARDANRRILESYGVKQTVVETNWKDYCVEWEMAFGFGVTAVLHHFNKSHQFGIWSADEDYRFEVRPWGNHSSQNPLLSDRSFPIFATGTGLDRSSKVKAIATNPEILRNIRVCWAFPVKQLNCGKCEKCVRTYLNFKIAGVETVEAISKHLKPSDVSRIKIKHETAKMFYSEILENSSTLRPAYRRAVRHALRMSWFYMRLKKFLDRRPRLKRCILAKVNPRSHY